MEKKKKKKKTHIHVTSHRIAEQDLQKGDLIDNEGVFIIKQPHKWYLHPHADSKTRETQDWFHFPSFSQGPNRERKKSPQI